MKNSKNKAKIKEGSSNVMGVILLVLLISCALVALVFSFVKLTTGKSLTELMAGMRSAKTTAATETDTDNDTDTDTDTDTDADADLPVFSTTKGRASGVYNFLVAGVNSSCGNNADMIAVVNYNVKTNKANVVQIPRDTYINEPGRSYHKINSYYTAYYNRSSNTGGTKNASIKAGMNELCKYTAEILGEEIDGWVYLDTAGFASLVDAFGGVEIDVPFDMYYSDPDQNLTIDIKKGPQTLSGAAAAQFVRFRSGYENADYGRMDAQKMFITAFIKTVKKNFSATAAINAAGAAIGNVTTSLKSNEFLYFAAKAYSLDLADVTFVTLPTTGVYIEEDAQWYEVAGRQGASVVVGAYLHVFEGSYDSSRAFDPNRKLTGDLADLQNAYSVEPTGNPGKAKTGTQIENGAITIPEKKN